MPIGLLLGGAAAAFLVIVGGMVLFQKFGSAAGIRISSADVGLGGVVGDSPKAILGDSLDVIDDLLVTVRSVTDAESAQAAVPKLEKLEEQLVELQRRAVLVDPIPRDEMRAVENSFGKPDSAKAFKGEAERLKDAGLIDGEFAAAMRSLGFRMQSTVGVLKDGMIELPEPKNEFETLARDYVELGRERARILARIETAADVPNAVQQYKALVSKIEALTERKAAFGRQRQSAIAFAQNKYTFHDTGGAVVGLRLALPEDVRESPELRQAQSDVATAQSQYEFALIAGGSHLGSGDSPDGSAAGVAPVAGRAEGAGRPMEPAGLGEPQRFGPPPTPFGPGRPGFAPGPRRGPPELAAADKVTIILQGGPFASAGHLKGQEFFAAKRRQNDAQRDYVKRLKTLADSNSSHSTITGGTSQNTLAYKGDVQQLADRIDFGTVTDVNAETRTITVEMPDVAEPPEEDKPAQPGASSNGGFDV